MPLILLLVTAAAASDCAAPASTAQLSALLDAAEAGWQAADPDTFLVRMDEAVVRLPCVDVPVAPPLAARFHRDLGLWLFVNDQLDRAAQAFAAASQHEAGALPLDLVPASHRARTLSEQGTPSADAEVLLPPVSGSLWLDGETGLTRAGGRAVIAQVVDADSQVVHTRYLFVGDPLPPYDAIPLAEEPDLGELPPAERTGLELRPWHVGVLSGALAVAGATSGALAWHDKQAFLTDQPGNLTSLETLYTANRRKATAATALGGLAGVAAVGAVVLQVRW